MKALKILQPLWLGVTFVACASAAPQVESGPREHGLKQLRALMDLSEPAGRLDGERLMHTASGMELLTLPPAADWVAEKLEGTTLLFEGTPGVALVIAGSDARLARMIDGELKWAPVLKAVPDSPLQPLLKAERKTGPGLPTGDEAPRVAKVDVKGYPNGLTVMLTTQEIVVASSADLDSDLQYGSKSEADTVKTCSGSYTASVKVAKLADGSSLLLYERDAEFVLDEGECEDAIASRASFAEWVHFPVTGGGARVVMGWTESSNGYETNATERGLLDLPGGTLTYEVASQDAMMGDSTRSAKWTLQPTNGAAVELVSTY